MTDLLTTSATASPASPASPISSSIASRSPILSMRKEIVPTAASAVTTVTTATSATWTPMDRRASTRCPTTPMAVVSIAVPPTHSATCARSCDATYGMISAMFAIMLAPARTGSRRPRR